MTKAITIPLGFEVGTGAPVEIPLAHTFVTGQTQLSGKTTTLRAIVARSGQRALAFVTKRGESFDGTRIPPYLPRDGSQPIPWRLVETILASSLGERKLKWERYQIITASRGALSLEAVRRNVEDLRGKAKGKNAEVYELLGEYFDLVLPEMRALQASHALVLGRGLNVMDLSGTTAQLQALVIRAALERINAHEEGVLTVFPEAWEFAPRDRQAPAKDAAIAMIRKGAVLRNFLLCDSQDIAGVDTVVRQGAHVWILGVQRELNEVKRTLQTIPAGITRPKPEAIAELELGQFFACWGRHTIKTYVRPEGMPIAAAREVAMGQLPVADAMVITAFGAPGALARAAVTKEATVTKAEAERLRRENVELRQRIDALERRLAASEGHDGAAGSQRAHAGGGDANRRTAVQPPAAAAGTGSVAVAAAPPGAAADFEAWYAAVKDRLCRESWNDPVVLRVLLERPELQVSVTRRTIAADAGELSGRVAVLLSEGWFDQAKGATATATEMKRRGWDHDYRNVAKVCDRLTIDGFFLREGGSYLAVPGMKVRVVEA